MNITNFDESAPLISRHGIPALVRDDRTNRQKQLAVFFILATTLFERLAFYSLTTNINLTVISNESDNNHWNPLYSSTSLLYIFSGTCYISTFLFAIVTDRFFGRGKTILIGFGLYLIGFSLLTITTSDRGGLFCSYDTRNITNCIPLNGSELACNRAILIIMIVIAIGAGAVKSNLAVFGADQIQESRLASRYFDKYVVATNIGSAIAIGVIPYVFNTSKDCFIGYLIALPMPFIAALLFVAGWPFYLHVLANETVIINLFPVIISAFQSRHKYEKDKAKQTNKRKKTTRNSTLLNASGSISDSDRQIVNEDRPPSFLDFAKVPYGKYHDRIVDDVKSLRGALVVFSLLMPYWLVYNQRQTTFQTQGMHMNGKNLSYMVYIVSLGDPLTIIIGIFIFNTFIYKCLEVRHWSLLISTKLFIGMIIACLCMCIAGTVELIRQNQCSHHQDNLSVFLQIPQYVTIGVAEIFALVASYEFAYYAAPFSAQSLFMSLHFCSAGLASFLNIAYMAIVSPTSLTSDFSCSSIKPSWVPYGSFFIFGGLQLIAAIIFIICQKRFEIIKLNVQQTESNQFFQS